MLDTKDIKWDILIDQLEQGTCAIVLGNGLLTDQTGQALFTKFCRQYATDNNDLIHAYYPEENFFLFKKPQEYSAFGMYVKKFCSSALYQEYETLYRKLAEIPVPLYVSIAPDDFLARALGTQAQYTYYGDKNVKVREVEATPENPLLYQLFGSIKNTSSLVCSHDGLYDLLKAILENKQLPAALEQFFQESAMGHVLFLGFDFKQWYVQLILRILNLTKPTNGLNRTATQQQIVAESTEIAEQHFQINFIDKDCAEFVNILYQKCKDAGLLRTITSNGETVAKISEEAKKQRIGDIKTQFTALIKLKGEWEQEKMFTDNPKKAMQCEMEIEKTNGEMQKLQQELQTLTN